MAEAAEKNTLSEAQMVQYQKAMRFIKEHQNVVPEVLDTEVSRLDHKATRKLFLDTLHSGNEGVIFLPRKKHWANPEDAWYTDKETGKKKRKAPFNNSVWYRLSDDTDPDDLIWADTNDSYVAANPMDGLPDEAGRITRNEHHCTGINELHLDIDVLHALDPYDSTLADKVIALVVAMLHKTLPRPTMIVSSGRGLTWIYRYNKPIENPTTQEMHGKKNIVTSLNPAVLRHDKAFRMLIQKVQALFDKEIIDIDSHVTDHARILRMPGTINRKAERYAKLIECNPGLLYDPETLYALLGVTEELDADNVVISITDVKDRKTSGKKKSKPAAEKAGQAASHAKKDLDNIILFAPLPFRWAAKARIPKMLQIAKQAEMRDGMGRKKFLFAFYCHCRILYTRDTSYSKAVELNSLFAEPLDEDEFENQLRRVDMHEERPEWDMHSDGTYIFRAETLEEKFMPDCAAGVFTADQAKREEYKQHQEEAAARDQEIAELWLKGMSSKKISALLAGKYQHVSQDTIKRVVKRLGLTVQRTEKIENVDFEIHKRYGRSEEPVPPQELQPVVSVTAEGATLHESRGDEREEAVRIQDDFIGKIVSGENAFLTGKAGTGKSYTLCKAVELLRERGRVVKILAPSGVAADHVGGETINHGLRFSVESLYMDSVSSFSVQSLENVDTLVIDEISMVRIDLWGKMISVKRMAERVYGKRIQVVVCGDYHQIAPIVTEAELADLQPYIDKYGSVYAFAHPYGWEEGIWQNRLELTYVWRQECLDHCYALDQIAVGNMMGLGLFNNRVATLSKDVLLQRLDAGELYLGAFRSEVDLINEQMIEKHSHDQSYVLWRGMLMFGQVDETYSVDWEIPLYEGMPVIFVKNTKRYKNGTRGIVTKICEQCVMVDVGEKVLRVFPTNIHSQSGDGVIKQLPIRPCYAMTVHKSQGLTLDKVILNPHCFESGQLYTALSRVKSVDSLTLTQPIRTRDLITDRVVSDFYAMQRRVPSLQCVS